MSCAGAQVEPRRRTLNGKEASAPLSLTLSPEGRGDRLERDRRYFFFFLVAFLTAFFTAFLTAFFFAAMLLPPRLLDTARSLL